MGSMPGGPAAHDCSEATFHRVDDEVKKILDQCYRTARAILSEHRERI